MRRFLSLFSLIVLSLSIAFSEQAVKIVQSVSQGGGTGLPLAEMKVTAYISERAIKVESPFDVKILTKEPLNLVVCNNYLRKCIRLNLTGNNASALFPVNAADVKKMNDMMRKLVSYLNFLRTDTVAGCNVKGYEVNLKRLYEDYPDLAKYGKLDKLVMWFTKDDKCLMPLKKLESMSRSWASTLKVSQLLFINLNNPVVTKLGFPLKYQMSMGAQSATVAIEELEVVDVPASFFKVPSAYEMVESNK